ncbi:MAG: DUF4097 family beta strand repeat-containing protein [Opitutaceae bacterium]
MASHPTPLFALSRRGRLYAAFLIAGCSLAPSLTAETVERIEKKLDARPGGKLVVDIAGARIEVTTSSDPAVSIDFERKVRASSKEDEEAYLADRVVTIAQEGDTVIIRQKKPEKKWGFFSGWSRLRTKIEARCTVVVPSEFDVDLETSGGSISVASLTGDVRADTSGGGIRCENITGEVDADTWGGSIHLIAVHGASVADTSGGSITAETCSGELSADTSGGSIRVSRHRGNVEADTSGGSITFDEVEGNVSGDTSGGSIRATLATAPTTDCRLSTSGGGITVTMPAGAAVKLDAATSGGHVESDFDVAGVDLRKKRNDVQGNINGGGPLLHLRTSGGGIHVKQGQG